MRVCDHIAKFTAMLMWAMDDFPIMHQSATNARTNHEIRQVPIRTTSASPCFAQSRTVGIIFNRDHHAQPLRQRLPDGEFMDVVQGAAAADNPRLIIDRPRHAETSPRDFPALAQLLPYLHNFLIELFQSCRRRKASLFLQISTCIDQSILHTTAAHIISQIIQFRHTPS